MPKNTNPNISFSYEELTASTEKFIKNTLKEAEKAKQENPNSPSISFLLDQARSAYRLWAFIVAKHDIDSILDDEHLERMTRFWK